MTEFLGQLMDIVVLVIDLIKNVVTALLQFVLLIPRYIAFITLSFGYLPTIVFSFMMFGVFVCLLFLFLGRN